jgi:hypothetical protein
MTVEEWRLKQLQNQLPQSKTAAAPTPTSAAPKANAAPKPTTKSTVTGLMASLNQFQQSLTGRVQDIADIYEIEFDPPELGNARVIKSGNDKSATAMTSPVTAADQLDTARQSMDPTTREWQITSGTQIVQIIDMIMRNSSYITDQANSVIDEDDQEERDRPPLGNLGWYKITLEYTQLQFDVRRNDYAYRMRFIVSAYGINRMESEYFPRGTYRGPHKEYNYWFTGLNSQILNYEQEFNSLYYVALSNPDKLVQAQLSQDSREILPRLYMGTNNQSIQGAFGRSNDPGSSAADYLYSPADLAIVKLKIIGDPAWLQQGEVGPGVSAQNFNFRAFNSDGTINFEASQIAFTVSWNRAQDYDLSTGLADPNAVNATGQPRESSTYIATGVRSTFRAGKFEQELTGKILQVLPPAKPVKASQQRPAATAPPAATPAVRKAPVGSLEAVREEIQQATTPGQVINKTLRKLPGALAARNEVISNRIAPDNARAALENGSEEDINALGGRSFLESIANTPSPPPPPKLPGGVEDRRRAQLNNQLPQRMSRDFDPG